MQDTTQTLNLENITAEEVLGFRVIRTLHSNRLYNVVAVGKDDEILAVVYTDLSADEAVELVGTLNYPYDVEGNSVGVYDKVEVKE